MSEKEKQNREELFKLMRENPDLPVVPMVDYEVVGDDSGWWFGSWGGSYICECVLGKGWLYFREDDDLSEIENALSDKYGYDVIENWSDEKREKAYKELPWAKVIVVSINSPNE